ncbi:tripartite tricarboxylate transporter TctB family protein [Tardiphaga sp. vice154]|uniref:tripartite tricarboxylate transporter TctB family protein n=1 Tax=Tardiphaga sp. vice154 TaxID=2592814 RepID=UPI001163D0A8|nr:tripartite tricarboxylate transporter TctB family protein [Tardiphaga sp. vice154]QDM20786.1 tripartite tricarboxylate transporter TctB family protein [Tardiphaga sp. vice154]
MAPPFLHGLSMYPGTLPMRVKSQKDFAAGMLFFGFGVFFAVLAPRYNLGTPSRMGAGFFPLVLGIVLVVLGAAIIGRSLVGIRDTIDALNWRGLSFLLGAICLFGFVLKPLGLVIALLTLVLLGGLANREFGWIEGVALGVFLAVLASGLFVFALKLPLPLWPSF